MILCLFGEESCPINFFSYAGQIFKEEIFIYLHTLKFNYIGFYIVFPFFNITRASQLLLTIFSYTS